MFDRWFSGLKSGLKNAAYRAVAPAASEQIFWSTYDKAKADPRGIAIIPPGLVSQRVAILTGANESAVTDEQLRKIIDLDEPGSRSPIFDPIAEVTESSFFLNLQSEEAKSFRSTFTKFMRPDRAKDITDDLMKELFVDLRKGDLQLKDVKSKIKMCASSIISKTMFGFEYTPKLEELMETIEQYAASSQSMPSFIRNLDPAQAGVRKEIKEAVDNFLKEYINDTLKVLESDSSRLKKPTNLLEFHLARKIKDYYEENVSNANPEELIKDPDLRMCISGLLAARNMSSLIVSAIGHIYEEYGYRKGLSTDNKYFYDECEKIFDTQDKSSNLKDKYPYLHAFYLECLRYYPPSTSIVRHTSNGIKNEYLDIPPNTTIVFFIEAAMRKYFENDGHRFNIYHYLNVKPDEKGETWASNDKGDAKLDADKIKLKQGPNLAFGAGLRACPATGFTEIIFKKFIGNFAGNIHRLDFKPAYDPGGENKANTLFVADTRKAECEEFIPVVNLVKNKSEVVIDHANHLLSRLKADEQMGALDVKLNEQYNYLKKYLDTNEKLNARYDSLMADLDVNGVISRSQAVELQNLKMDYRQSIKYLLYTMSEIVSVYRTLSSPSSSENTQVDKKEFDDLVYQTDYGSDEAINKLINRQKELLAIVARLPGASADSILAKNSLFAPEQKDKAVEEPANEEAPKKKI